MYIPTFNQENNISTLHKHIKKHPFAMWTTVSNGEIIVNHLPFLLDEKKGEHGTLFAHVAKANPIWQNFSKDMDSVVVFQGEQAYISPSWYPSKHKHGKAVPTWNYVVVHAYGIPTMIDDREWLLKHVTELTDLHEHEQQLPWKVSDAPDDYINKLLGAIIGIEIPITKLLGKWKLGQNRPESDRMGVVAGLSSRDDPQSHGMAQLVKRSTALGE